MKVTLARPLFFVVATLCWTEAANAAKSEDDDDIVVAADPKKTAPPPVVTPAPTREPTWLEKIVEPFSVMAFLQADMHGSQLSEDQVQQGGALLNQDAFVIKTARVRVDATWKYVAAQLELETNTVHGPVIRPYHVFGTLRLPSKDPKAPAIATASMGIFDTPFGYEGPESPRFRFFMERSLVSRAFFPGVPDLGLAVGGSLGAFRWSFAAMNNQPLDTLYQGLAPVSAKALVTRVAFDAHPRGDLDIAGGVSALRGRGFHPGTDATKNQIVWNDVNEDGTIQPAELVGRAATSAIPSKSFDQWAVDVDLQVRFKTKLGTTAITGEVTLGDNMDRGLYVADPVFLGQDTREIGWHADITQEITKWAVVGFRYDYYDPNLDAFDKRGGQLFPVNQTIQAFSPLVGFVFPGVMTGNRAYGKARLLFQYDFIRDHLGRSLNGLPGDLANDAWTVRLQVEL